jgi:hypothetical protein
MLFREIFAVYSKKQTKLINTLNGRNAELLNVKADGRLQVVNTMFQSRKFYYTKNSRQNT